MTRMENKFLNSKKLLNFLLLFIQCLVTKVIKEFCKISSMEKILATNSKTHGCLHSFQISRKCRKSQPIQFCCNLPASPKFQPLTFTIIQEPLKEGSEKYKFILIGFLAIEYFNFYLGLPKEGQFVDRRNSHNY